MSRFDTSSAGRYDAHLPRVTADTATAQQHQAETVELELTYDKASRMMANYFFACNG